MLCESVPGPRRSYPRPPFSHRRWRGEVLGSIRFVDLFRAWVRQLAAASLAAVCIPVAVLGALVVVAFTGGFGSLGALEQIFSGPVAPSSPAGLTQAPAAAVVSRLATAPVRAGASPARPIRSAARPRAAVPASGLTYSDTIQPIPRPVAAESAPVPASAPSAPSLVSTPAAIPSSQPAPPPPTVVDRAVSAVSTLTGPLPGGAGPAATQAVQSAASDVPPGQAPAAPAPVPGVGLP
jgi:hypothetical protein